MARKIIKILTRTLLVILLFLIAVWVLINLTPVQNWLVKQAARRLSHELNTEVTVKHVDFSLFNKMLLEGVLVKDRQKDTLAYIGRAGVNINDWFFLKDKIELKYVSLEQTDIFLHRTDSIWNYQFLIDYFSPGNSKTSDTSKKAIALLLKKADLKAIRIVQKDEWRGETMEAHIGHLNLDLNKFDLAGKVIDANIIELSSPYFALSNYSGKRPKRKARPDEYYHQNDSSTVHWNNGWKITSGKVTISNGEFRNDIATERPAFTYFDGAHIQFKDINGSFSNVRFTSDTIETKIHLSAKERSGLEVKKLNADLLWHPLGMEFKNLDAQTNKSSLKDYFAMRYTQFNHDMSEFITHVVLDGNMENSVIHSDDIAFFAPELKDWNDIITINGKVKGTVNHLKGNNVTVSSLKNTILDGSFTLDGLPDVNSTFLDLKANRLETSYADASAIYPGIKKIKSPALSKINYLKFQGSFTGYFNDFVTYGTIQTNLGTLVTDINLKLPEKSDPIYSGKLKTEGFQLGTFLQDTLFGKIAMNGSIKGRGFSMNKLFAEIDGKISSFEINGYNYKDITAKGIYEKRLFDGALNVKDPNLNINLTGQVNFSKDTPMYNVTGDVYKINFKPLGLLNKNLTMRATVDLNFRGKNIDDFLGTANLKNAELVHDGTPLSFDYLSLSSVITNGIKALTLESNEAEASLKGTFNIFDLPTTTLSFLHNYFPAYIPVPKKQVQNQDFSFHISTKDIAPFLSLLDIPVSGFENSSFNGRISTNENMFSVQADVPMFTYKKTIFNNTRITGNGDYGKLNLSGTLDEIRLTDSLSLPQTKFTVTASNDTGTVSIQTKASQTLKDANLNAKINTTKEGVGIIFQPSTLVLNDKIWNIRENSDVFIGKQKISASGLHISSGTEEIFVYTQPSSIGNSEDLIAELKQFQIDGVMPYFLKDPRLEGSVTGKVEIADLFGKVQVDADLTTEKFRFNNDSIGVVKLNGNYNQSTGDINTNIISENPLNEFFGTGKINIKDPDHPVIDQIAEIKNVQLKLLQKYLAIIMTDLKGSGNGVIRIKGNARRPELIGNVKLSNASFVLDYTKCRYQIKEGTEINFREGELDFGNITLQDTTNRTATFSGKLFHHFFDSMAFRMNFKANDPKKGLVVLNTKKKDNSLFYGYVVANASGSINGKSDNIILRLSGEPTDSSHVSLPTSDSRVTGTADFIVFRKYGKEMKVESDIKETSKLTVDVDINANPLAKVDLILDEITNDIVQGQGNGFLNIRVSTNEPTTMNGWFDITKGQYTFNWQALIKKPFDINKGRIDWDGDPYNAKINIDARYTAKEITLPDYLTRDCNNIRSDLYVISNLSGTLINPVINFRFELPQSHPCRNSQITLNGFQQLYNNPNELNNQVFSLMFFNQFMTSNSNTTAAGNNIGMNLLTNTAASTISEFLAQQITSGIGLVLKTIPGLNKLNLDPYVTFNPGTISGLQAQQLFGSSSFGFTKRFLNGRVVLKAGGNVLLNSGQTTTVQNNNQLTPDITIEWLISPDGKLRLIGFYKTTYDLQWRTSNRTGISFSYVKDFDKLF